MRTFKRNLITALVAWVALVAAFSAQAVADDKYVSTPYSPVDNISEQIDGVLAKAKSDGKLALFALGANWCHDSRALGDALLKDEIEAQYQNDYELAFVDVGPLSKVREITDQLGVPVIYGTPTVLVIDPNTGKILNKDTSHLWRDVSLYSDDRIIELLGTRDAAMPAVLTDAQAEKLSAIKAFEDQQAERLYGGFAALKPFLSAEAGNRPEGGMAIWGEVRDFRYQLTKDLSALRAAAMAGEDLIFPDYGTFSWE